MIFGDLTSPDIGRIAAEAVAVLPVAATEQHGQHLPVITDTALVSEIASRAEAALPDSIVLLPTLWVGNSHHHLGFPGTISISSETYIRVLQDMADCLLQSGFRRIVFLNGHGGNITPLSEALYRLSQRPAEGELPWIAAATYWRLGQAAVDRAGFMESPRLTHACEYETSMMLGLRAEWVQMDKAHGVRTERHSKFYDPLSYVPSTVTVSETFAQMTPTGAMGDPALATREKGARLLDIFAEAIVDFLREFSGWSFRRCP